ncbi:PEP-CTERM/exosortase system-associated acyltransferase [Methylobacter sp.]|uniref:PEP-CTERM/exosortase system-associated acyltransferase n=1 Tax=Methylobacter sp. TaxID=2051955 RepID=UPI002FDEADDC
MANIIDIFNKYFEMIPAISEELKHEVYKLRYQVYCLENGSKTGFKSPVVHPEGLEFDEDDRHSCHYLIRHREQGNYIATTRLILPDAGNRDYLFPIERYSQIADSELLQSISRHHLAELSRFCVSKEFRRRKNEPHLLTTIDTDSGLRIAQEDKRSSSHLTLALFACAVKMSAENNIHYWYAIMEPALMRVFSTLGIHFVEIGPLLNLYGMRQPCVIKVDDLLDSVAKKDLAYWNMLTNNGQFPGTASNLHRVKNLVNHL